MWHRKTELVAYLATINKNGSLDVRSLKVKGYLAFLPSLGHNNLALIPCIAHVIALGSKEERKLHLPLVAILLHVGIKIKTGVVERASPLGVNTYGIALAVGKHRTGKQYGVIVLGIIAHTEIPFTTERYRILRLNIQAKYHA